MPDRRTRPPVMWALPMALLMVVGAGAATEDLRLVDAMKNQDLQRVRTLLDQHADVNVRSEDGSTALLWAAHWNDLQAAELLVRAGADANAANDFRMTPLSQACTNGSAALVNVLRALAMDAVQIMGAYGTTGKSGAEKYFRDAKMTQIFEGTNELCRLAITAPMLQYAGLGSIGSD